MPKLLTTKQAAELRGVKIDTIKSWIYKGMKAKKHGRAHMIRQSDLMKFQPNKPGNPHKTNRRLPKK